MKILNVTMLNMLSLKYVEKIEGLKANWKSKFS